ELPPFAFLSRAPRRAPEAQLLLQAEAAEALVELRNLPAAIDQTMLAGPGRMGLGVDVQAHGLTRLAVGRARLVLGPVGHHDGDLVIIGVDVFLHGSGPLKRRAVYPTAPPGASLGSLLMVVADSAIRRPPWAHQGSPSR